MAKKTALVWQQNQLADALEDLAEWLEDDGRFDHIRVKKRGSALTLCSTADNGSVDHARFTLVDRDYWGLSLPLSSGRWERTPFAGSLREVYDTVAGALSFHLTER